MHVDSDAVPAGLIQRRPVPRDAERILQLYTAYTTPLVGLADSTLDDVQDTLADPELDLTRDAWVVETGGGALTGFGFVCREGDSDQVELDVVATDHQVRDWLLDQVIERGGEIAAELGHPRARLRHGTYREDTALRQRLGELGFTPVTVFSRMRIDHDGPVVQPPPPPGVALRHDPDDPELRHTAHALVNTAFREHFGFAEETAQRWIATWDARSTFDWSQLYVAELDGRPAGVLLCTDQFVADENCGYVAELGVVPQARGHGIATYLLRTAFALDAAAGRAGTILHVDTNNTTPALTLYEGVGMRPVLTIDVFENVRSLPA